MIGDYPEEKYHEIKATIPEDLPAIVLTELKLHIGRDNRISRKELISRIFGIQPAEIEDLGNSSLDRQIRVALSQLQENYPILSTSGGGGYFYASSIDEINRYAAEILARAKALQEKARRLEKLAKKFRKDIQLPLL